MAVVTRFGSPQELDLVPAESGCDAEWTTAIEKLRSLYSLEEDWDGQGAVAPTPAVVDTAIRLAKQLQDDEKVCPLFAIAGVDGTVVFEWHLPAGFLQIEVMTPDCAEQRWVPKGASEAVVTHLRLRRRAIEVRPDHPTPRGSGEREHPPSAAGGHPKRRSPERRVKRGSQEVDTG